MNKFYETPNYSSSTRSYHKGRSTCGLRVVQYRRATWTILQIHDMATTTSTRKYTTPSVPITDFINLYIYNYPEDYAQNSVQFTQQDYYFV
eukprot:5031407-Amphidinium_carterae.1